jgi:hypothetical protein
MAKKSNSSSGRTATGTRNEMHTFEVYVERTTGAALLCVLTENLEDIDPPEFWLPTSQIEIIDINHKKNWYTVEVPEWLAIEKGLL